MNIDVLFVIFKTQNGKALQNKLTGLQSYEVLQTHWTFKREVAKQTVKNERESTRTYCIL